MTTNPPPEFRCGYVAVIGPPNVGKSTLLNQLLKYKISIVSHRPQTTRRNVIGILNQPDLQVVFLDTPGMINPEYNLQRFMMRQVSSALKDADILVYIVDATRKHQRIKEISELLRDIRKPVILVINKVDLVRDKRQLLPMLAQLSEAHDFKALIPVSAEKDDGIDILLKEISKVLPEGHPFYPTDYISDQQERYFVAEIIREKVFRLYREEIPYACHVEIEEFSEKDEGKDYIRAAILIERSSQKSILIGKQGASLKRVGEMAREDIQVLLGREVFLELYVKVAEDWRRKEEELKRLGYR